MGNVGQVSPRQRKELKELARISFEALVETDKKLRKSRK